MFCRPIGLYPIRFVAAGEIALMGVCAASELCQKQIPDHAQELHSLLRRGGRPFPVTAGCPHF